MGWGDVGGFVIVGCMLVPESVSEKYVCMCASLCEKVRVARYVCDCVRDRECACVGLRGRPGALVFCVCVCVRALGECVSVCVYVCRQQPGGRAVRSSASPSIRASVGLSVR